MRTPIVFALVRVMFPLFGRAVADPPSSRSLGNAYLRLFKSSPFSLQKQSFWRVKAALLQAKRAAFEISFLQGRDPSRSALFVGRAQMKNRNAAAMWNMKNHSSTERPPHLHETFLLQPKKSLLARKGNSFTLHLYSFAFVPYCFFIVFTFLLFYLFTFIIYPFTLFYPFTILPFYFFIVSLP